MFRIYLIENMINGKLYIGQTRRSIARRWANHKYDAKRGFEFPLYRAIRKYGSNNFEIREIDKIDTIELANERETFWIKFFHSHLPDVGYNGTLGGDGMCHPTGEVLQKMIEAGKRFTHHTEESKLKISMAGKGRKATPEAKENMRKAATKREANKFLKTVAWS
jgi:group I intron endonuclease